MRFVPWFVVAVILSSAIAYGDEVSPNAPAPRGTRVTKKRSSSVEKRQSIGTTTEAEKMAPAKAGKKSWTEGHLALGTRITYFQLRDSKRSTAHTFVGHINELDEDQDYAPTKLFVDYYVSPYWGFELTWDELRAETKNEGGTEDVDGAIELSGPILTVMGRYPNKSVATPYAGAGVAILNASFDHRTWWHQGYSSEPDWIALGSPSTPRNNRTRTMTLDDTVGWVLAVGCDIRLAGNWSLDVYGRYMEVDVDNDFTIRRGSTVTDETKVTIPMDNFAAGLGVRYSF